MSAAKLHDLLLARVFRSRRNGPPAPGAAAGLALTRRQFLSSTGSVGAAAFASLDPATPHLSYDGTAVVVRFADYIWRIDRTHFGGKARVTWDREGHDFVISLTDARLPGTDLDVSFTAWLRRVQLEWRIRLGIPAQRFEATATLDEWLARERPLTSRVATRTILAGGCHLSLRPPLSLSIVPEFGFRFDGDEDAVQFDGPFRCTAGALTFDIDAASQGTARDAVLSIHGTATRFGLLHAKTTSRAIAVSEEHVGSDLCCCADAATSVTGEVFGTPTGDAGLTVLEGPMRVFADMDAPPADDASQLRLERAVLMTSSGALPHDRALAGRISRTPQAIDVAGCQLTVSGDDERAFYIRANGSDQEPVARFQARVDRVWVPVGGTDGATLDVPARVVDIVLKGRAQSARDRRVDDERESRAVVVLSRAPYLLIPLDGCKLKVKRGLDLLNLEFAFTGFDFKVLDGEPWLLRHRPEKKGEDWPKATVTVTFPPQHLAEYINEMPPSCTETGAFPPISAARLSAPSRIAFDLCRDRKNPQWVTQPLSIDRLTEWRDLAMAVNDRALEPDADFDRQIKVAGLEEHTPLGQLPTILARQLHPPSAEETALTMSGRLVMSPSRKARWLTPQCQIDPAAAPLWHARLDTYGRRTVRALWSYYLTPGQFDFKETQKDPLLPLNAKHHWDIVAQSSLYGIPALRRITDVDTDRRPRSRVIRPEKDFDSLIDLDGRKGFRDKDSGFALPQPFDDADILLTSIGGSFVADWRGEPPALLYLNTTVNAKGFDLERLQYWSQLGRDIRVEAVDKGYMLPLGIRCSHVELVERRFFRHPQREGPVAYLIKRRFIIFGKPDKNFPGVNHPFTGRDFPAQRINMMTRKTPDLIDPVEGSPQPVPNTEAKLHASGLVTFDGENTFKIFWPRTRARPPASRGDVEFAWTVDDVRTPLTSQLLFVANSAVTVESVMGKVVRYYRSLPDNDPALCAARAGGARRRYAPAATDGDTSFDTDAWVLSAGGRLLAKGDNAQANNEEVEQFRMDGRMEGADQPPVYPIVKHAFITVQSLDRLLGKPQGLIKVGFTPTYVRNGFNTSLNPSEIFLSVISPDIALDVTGQGSATGGLAKPNTRVVALSRQIGVVGGVKTSGAGGQSLALAARAPTEVTRDIGARGPYVFDKALSGRFDQIEFLGRGAKLLGLISLAEVVTGGAIGDAPKLLERYGYGALNRAAAEALPYIKEIFGEARDGLESFLALILNRLAALPGGVRFQDLYPVLWQRFQTFDASVRTAGAEVRRAQRLDQIGDVLTGVVRDGRDLLAEIERTLRDPVPAVAQAALGAIRDGWQKLRDRLNERYLNLSQTLHRDLIRGALIEFCESLGTLKSALLAVDSSFTCADAIDYPADTIRRIQSTLFAEYFGEPLVRMLTATRGLQAQAKAKLTWAKSELHRHALAAIDEAAAIVKERLVAVVDPNIADKVAAELVRLFTVEVDKFFVPDTQSFAALTSTDIEEEFRQILLKLQALAAQVLSESFVRQSVEQAIALEPSLLKPRRPSDAAAILREFTAVFVERARQAADRVIGEEIARLRALVASQLQQARAQAVERLVDTVDQVLSAMAASVDFAQITDGVRGITAWCSAAAGEVPPVFAVVEILASKVLGTADNIRNRLRLVIEAAEQIAIPDEAAAAKPQFTRAIASLYAGIQQIAVVAGVIEEERDKIQGLRDRILKGLNLCADPAVLADLLNPAGRLMNLRHEAVARIQDVLERMVAVDALFAALEQRPPNTLRPAHISPRAAPADDWRQASTTILNEIRVLLELVTSLGEVPYTGVWTQAISQLQTLTAGDPPGLFGDYLDRLRAQLIEIDIRARALQARLSAPTPELLRAVAVDVAAYALEHDKRLAAAVTHSIALTTSLAADLQNKAHAIIKAAAGTAADIHRTAHGLLASLLAALDTEPVKTLVNPEVNAAIKLAHADVHQDQLLLDAIAATPTASAAVTAVRELVEQRWRSAPPALARVVAVLADLAETILHGDLAQLLNLDAIKDIFSDVETRVRAAIAELVPTKVHLSYAWQTSLGPFPKGSNPIFKMLQSAPDDLRLNVDIAVDLAAGTRTAVVKGTMKSFQVHLLGESIDIAKIKFAGASFESRNGAAPAFQAEIAEVELGKLVKFLKPLQAWLSPSGNGFYVKPVFNPPAIEAGYTFDADVIPLGAILFINVALGVSARLPFGDSAATFTFYFASPERPFMISAPPYGGGGYLSLVSNADRIVAFRFGLVFGAVIPIKFGPLRAQGRVVAGIYIIQTSNGSRTIGALVEAAGEGHIACFSISVCLRVGMEQETGDNNKLSGFSQFSFEFSIGITSLKFEFRASYTARNDKSGALNPGAAPPPPPPPPAPASLALGDDDGDAAARVLQATCDCPPQNDPQRFVYRVKTPRKATQWRDYRTRIAMDLL